MANLRLQVRLLREWYVVYEHHERKVVETQASCDRFTDIATGFGDDGSDVGHNTQEIGASRVDTEGRRGWRRRMARRRGGDLWRMMVSYLLSPSNIQQHLSLALAAAAHAAAVAVLSMVPTLHGTGHENPGVNPSPCNTVQICPAIRRILSLIHISEPTRPY